MEQTKAIRDMGSGAETIENSAPPAKRRSKQARNEEICGTIMGALPVLSCLVFSVVPMALALVMAFYKMRTPVSFTGAEFIWLDNFKEVIKDSNFWTAFLNTIIYSLTLPISLVLALFIAAALNATVRGTGIFRVILFLPFICSSVAIVFVWKWLFDTNYGVLNEILGSKVGWLDFPWMFRFSLIVMMVWAQTGYKVILLSASLTSVNQSYYEAADLDGANRWQKLVHITIPAVSPTLFFLLVTGFISILQLFSEVQVMDPTGGQSINYAALTLVFYIYRQGFNYNAMGVAAAASLLLTLVVLIITVFNFKISKLWVKYD